MAADRAGEARGPLPGLVAGGRVGASGRGDQAGGHVSGVFGPLVWRSAIAAMRVRDDAEREAGRLVKLACKFYTPAGCRDHFMTRARDLGMVAWAAELEVQQLGREAEENE